MKLRQYATIRDMLFFLTTMLSKKSREMPAFSREPNIQVNIRELQLEICNRSLHNAEERKSLYTKESFPCRKENLPQSMEEMPYLGYY